MKGSYGKDFPICVIASEVAEKVKAIYNRASIPCDTKKKRRIAKIEYYNQVF